MANLTKPQLQKALNALGVSYSPDANNAELKALLKAAKEEKQPKVNALLDSDGDEGDSSSEAPVEEEGEDEGEVVGEEPSPQDPTPDVAPESPNSETSVQESAVAPTAGEPVPGGALSATQTKAILDKEPKINFLVPLFPGEKEGAYENVTVNGYRYTIKKGVMVEIPKTVANILADHYRISMSAGAENEIGRKEDVEKALS
jgi:hypothetical protein